MTDVEGLVARGAIYKEVIVVRGICEWGGHGNYQPSG